MSQIRRFDHVGITVADLNVVTTFFVALGMEVEGRMFVEGDFLDTVCGIPDSRTEIVMLKPPDDGTRIELSSFVRPESVPGSPTAMANEQGRGPVGHGCRPNHGRRYSRTAVIPGTCAANPWCARSCGSAVGMDQQSHGLAWSASHPGARQPRPCVCA